MGKRVTIMIDADLDKKLRLRQAKIISLLLLSVLVTLSITFDESFAHPDPPHKNDPTHQYYLPTLIFDEKDYPQDSTIPATCIPDDSKSVRSLDWRIVNTDIHRSVLHEKHQQEDYSFLADFEEGNYKINCRTGFVGGGYSLSEWKEFSISGIVDSAEPPSTDLYNGLPDFTTQAIHTAYFTNEVDMKYDPVTKDLTIYWNFGISPDRESCNSKTEFVKRNYQSLEPLRYAQGKDYFHFEGTNTDTLSVGGLGLKHTDLITSKIECEGSLTFNLETTHQSNYTDEFALYMTFFEVISPDQRNNSRYTDDIRADGKIVLNEAQFVTTTLGDLESATCGELNSSTDEWRFVELIYDRTGPTLITFDTVEGCYTDSNQIPLSIQQTLYKKKNGSGNSPPPPTFGKNKNYDQIVTYGFCFNAKCVDVDNYHTEFPLIVAPVGEISNITVKAYNPSNGVNQLKWIQIILGVPEVGKPLSTGEVINTFYLSQGEIDKVVIIDDKKLIGNPTLSTSIVKCSDKYSSDCLELSFNFIPRDKLINNVVGINVVNLKNSGSTNFINHGIEFHGESLNEPLISFVSASKGGAFYPQDRGTVELQLINYSESLWQDEYGYLWKPDNSKSFKIISDIPVPLREPDLMWSVMTRMNSNFDSMIIHEQNRAVWIFDASQLISIPAESWTYDLPKTKEKVQAELDVRLALEADRAEKQLEKYFDYIYPGKVND